MQIILKACDCGQIADISGVRCADGELLAYQRLSRHSYISCRTHPTSHNKVIGACSVTCYIYIGARNNTFEHLCGKHLNWRCCGDLVVVMRHNLHSTSCLHPASSHPVHPATTWPKNLIHRIFLQDILGKEICLCQPWPVHLNPWKQKQKPPTSTTWLSGHTAKLTLALSLPKESTPPQTISNPVSTTTRPSGLPQNSLTARPHFFPRKTFSSSWVKTWQLLRRRLLCFDSPASPLTRLCQNLSTAFGLRWMTYNLLNASNAPINAGIIAPNKLSPVWFNVQQYSSTSTLFAFT